PKRGGLREDLWDPCRVVLREDFFCEPSWAIGCVLAAAIVRARRPWDQAPVERPPGSCDHSATNEETTHAYAVHLLSDVLPARARLRLRRAQGPGGLRTPGREEQADDGAQRQEGRQGRLPGREARDDRGHDAPRAQPG